MRYRPSRSFILSLTPLLAIGSAGFWAWQKANGAPMQVRGHEGFMAALRYQPEPKLVPPTDEERRRSRAAVLELKETLISEFPVLGLDQREPMPPEANGYLQLRLLSERMDEDPSVLDQDFRRLFEGHAPWDPAAVADHLAAHTELVSEITAIAALPHGTCIHLPEELDSYIHVRQMLECAGILLAKARLAAEAGDEGRALLHVAAARRLASHVWEIEVPSLLPTTGVILIDRRIDESILTELLPALGPGADPALWRDALGDRRWSAAEFARVIRGEWHAMAENHLLPAVVHKNYRNRPPDGERLARFTAFQYGTLIEQLRESPLSALHEGLDFATPPPALKLSSESRELLDALHIGADSWGKGFVRMAVLSARTRAILQLLEHERRGEHFDGELPEGFPVDPLTGRSFVFDPEDRTLSLPEECEIEAKHAALPW